jgi:NADH-quinone oxidoreductase subunit K/multicomponent Na+:H+ antiporter subunit C
MLELSLIEIFLLTSGSLILIGVFGIITRVNLLKILLSINILQTGVNLLLVSIGYSENGNAPILTKNISSMASFVDPLPQALVLTSIVIAFGTTALGLAVAILFFKKKRTLNIDQSDKIDMKAETE